MCLGHIRHYAPNERIVHAIECKLHDGCAFGNIYLTQSTVVPSGISAQAGGVNPVVSVLVENAIHIAVVDDDKPSVSHVSVRLNTGCQWSRVK